MSTTEPAGNATKERVVQLLYGSGGGGHLAPAEALAAALSEVPGVRAELVNASAVVGALPGDALYNWFLSYNAVPAIEFMHLFIYTFLPLATPFTRASLRAHWRKQRPPDAVVSFIPTLNACIAETLPKNIPFFSVLTDFSHTHAHCWLQHPRQHIVAGTTVAQRQAAEGGWSIDAAPGEPRYSPTSGMVVHPRFYKKITDEERSRLYSDMDFDESLPTVLICYGGSPPTGVVTQLFNALTAKRDDDAVNLVVVCGHNTALLERLKPYTGRRVHVVGFTRQIPHLMQLSDMIIGKSGAGVVSEAFVSGVPVLLVTGENDRTVMFHEQEVVTWVRDTGVGLGVSTPEDAALVSRSQLEQMRENIRRHPPNKAVFEVRSLVTEAVAPSAVRKRTEALERAHIRRNTATAAAMELKELVRGRIIMIRIVGTTALACAVIMYISLRYLHSYTFY